eukprot:8317-Pelagococcus_subviridis.AAC.1
MNSTPTFARMERPGGADARAPSVWIPGRGPVADQAVRRRGAHRRRRDVRERRRRRRRDARGGAKDFRAGARRRGVGAPGRARALVPHPGDARRARPAVRRRPHDRGLDREGADREGVRVASIRGGGGGASEGRGVARVGGRGRTEARSDSRWSPYDRVGVVNADP